MRIKARAIQLLALREHSRAELARKLRARLPQSADGEAAQADAQPFEADLQAVLDELEQQGLLSDRRTADALLQAKASRYGNRRLRQMLQARSLDAGLVADTLDRARPSELERAQDVWRRRFGHAPVDLKDRARQQRFLAGRGFEPAVIETVLKQAGSPDDPARED